MSENYKLDKDYQKDVAFFGQVIVKNIRVFKGLSQKQLGEIIGKKEITVRTYENGRSKVSVEILFLITRRLNITRKDFVAINSFLMESSQGDFFLDFILDDLYPREDFDNPEIERLVHENTKKELIKNYNSDIRECLMRYFYNIDKAKKIGALQIYDEKKVMQRVNEVMRLLQLLNNQKEETEGHNATPIPFSKESFLDDEDDKEEGSKLHSDTFPF